MKDRRDSPDGNPRYGRRRDDARLNAAMERELARQEDRLAFRRGSAFPSPRRPGSMPPPGNRMPVKVTEELTAAKRSTATTNQEGAGMALSAEKRARVEAIVRLAFMTLQLTKTMVPGMRLKEIPDTDLVVQMVMTMIDLFAEEEDVDQIEVEVPQAAPRPRSRVERSEGDDAIEF